MLRVVLLPANHGGCIWLEYGDSGAPQRVMIDGGPPYAWPKIKARLPADGCRFELLVVTHIDADHIGGVLEMLTQLP
jgi:glyoxylase-like metal-dependent hydrolase (beta-lactamase superfamily II)